MKKLLRGLLVTCSVLLLVACGSDGDDGGEGGGPAVNKVNPTDSVLAAALVDGQYFIDGNSGTHIPGGVYRFAAADGTFSQVVMYEQNEGLMLRGSWEMSSGVLAMTFSAVFDPDRGSYADMGNQRVTWIGTLASQTTADLTVRLATQSGTLNKKFFKVVPLAAEDMRGKQLVGAGNTYAFAATGNSGTWTVGSGAAKAFTWTINESKELLLSFPAGLDHRFYFTGRGYKPPVVEALRLMVGTKGVTSASFSNWSLQ
jgi:hypothetical protein